MSDDSDDDAIMEYLFDEDVDVVQYMCESVNGSSTREQVERSRRRPNLDRGIAEGHERIFRDYFSNASVYSYKQFERRFRMPSALFCRILQTLQSNTTYFQQKRDATGKLGASSLQKMAAAIRVLAFGVSSDTQDDYIRLSESTINECRRQFCAAVVDEFGEIYLREPSARDIEELLAAAEKRGVPGMLGSLDCTHWQWKNCPTSYAGAYQGKSQAPTIVLEAIADHRLWIWHAFFGMPGSLNDINVLNRSHLYDRLLAGKSPPCNYILSGTARSIGYVLVDGIYPAWSTFVQGFSNNDNAMKEFFTNSVSKYRKDVERAFGVLKAKWHILAKPCALWFSHEMEHIMKACIIMHNMIIEYNLKANLYDDEEVDVQSHSPQLYFEPNAIDRTTLQDRLAHANLRNDLMQHLWTLKGQGYIFPSS